MEKVTSLISAYLEQYPERYEYLIEIIAEELDHTPEWMKDMIDLEKIRIKKNGNNRTL